MSSMDGVEVTGEDITPEVMQEPGWLNVHVKKSTKKAAEVAERVAIAERGRGISKAAPRMRKPTAPRQPQLPPEFLKVVLRPRGGFDATQLPTVAVRDGVLRAAEITYDKASGDTLRVNFRQNTLTMSTPSKENAVLYSKITTIRINANDYETVAYVTAPEDTSKGVIHGIPEEETQEDIEKSLVNERNPGILHARRMGKTNIIIIAFEGQHVPHYVF